MGLVAKAFQDIITFSRASSGTYVNSNGYITNSSVLNYLTYSNQPENAAWTKSNSFVQTNLLTYSEQFDNAAWSKVGVTVAGADINATIAPDGTLTADKIAEDATTSVHSIYQVYSAVSGTIYTMSFYAKAAERTWVRTRGEIGINYFNLAAGTVGTTASGVTATIIAVGNGWYRCIATKAAATTGVTNSQIAPTTADNVDSYAGTAGSGIYAWGAQVVQGSVPGDYRATTTAALPCLYADYNGALRARKLCENTATSSHSTAQSIAVTAGVVYTASVKIKAAERGFAQLRYENGGSTEYFAVNVNLSTGAYAISTFGTPTSTFATVTPDDDGYWKVTISAAASNTTFVVVVFMQSVFGTNSYTGDGSSGIYIADAQLNDGSSALSYYDTTASAYNAPRFDYDPVTLAAKGLLVEESRANLLLYSNDFSNAVWSKANITLTAGAALGPDGTFSMTKLEATASTTTTCRQVLLATSTSHTFSVYAKQGSGATQANLFAVYNNTTASDVAVINFNYSTGVVTQTVGTGATATNVGNGIWRIAMPVTSGLTAGNSIAVYTGFSGAAETAGEFAYFSATQVEAGAFATSYIPTVASQVTRAADVASVNTLSPWFNQASGTIYVEADTFEPSVVAVRNAVAINDGSSNNVHRVLSYGGKIGGNTITASVTVADLQPLTYTTNTTFKFAYAYAANDFVAVGNGGAPSTDVAGALPTGLTVMGIGNLSGVIWCGHMRRITYYPRRLTNAELQTLTTL